MTILNRDVFARTFAEHRGERSGDVRLPDPTRPDPTRNSGYVCVSHQSVDGLLGACLDALHPSVTHANPRRARTTPHPALDAGSMPCRRRKHEILRNL